MATVRPDKKAITSPPYASIHRYVGQWSTPTLAADRWRAVVRSQPVAIICREKLIGYTQSLKYTIKARRANEDDEYKAEVDYYTAMLSRVNGAGFDNLIDLMLQDALDLPVGGTSEIVRYNPSDSILPHPHPDGHVYDVVFMDGATISPTYSSSHPIMQQVQTARRYFSKSEVGRILFTPRPEIMMTGMGMAPPERIYLALNMLYQGDKYYANLLMDIPEAGILDLGDMSADSATSWLTGLRSLLTGSDPFKVPVLYEHESTAKFIAFNRPPTEMLFDTTTEKYARLTAAGYWLTLGDIGLEKDGTLAGQIRRERGARLTGFGIVKEKVSNFINQILPPYLEFVFVEKDEEAMVAKGRAALVMTQAVSKMIDSGLVSPEDGQRMLIKEGVITIEVAPPTDVPPTDNPATEPAVNELSGIVDKVPAELGGHGDITATVTKSMGVAASLDFSKTEDINAPVRSWYSNGAHMSNGHPLFSLQTVASLRDAYAAAVIELIDKEDRQSATKIKEWLAHGIVPPLVGNVASAMYQVTQAAFKDAGISEVVLYRVIPVEDTDIRVGDVLPINIDGAIDAWMLFDTIAVEYALSSVGAAVVAMHVPVGKIFMTGRAGLESINDGVFFVIMSDNDTVTVYHKGDDPIA